MSGASSISTNSYSTTTDVPNGLNIEINWDSSVASAPSTIKTEFMADVEAVADQFASALQPISSGPITIDVGYGEINGSKVGGSALGESETNLQPVPYSTLVSDLGVPASHPNGTFYVSDAEAQALNIITTAPPVDGYIGFSSQSGIFAFNTSNGIGPSQYDFEGTVAHEISEVLGRIFLSGHSYSAFELFHYSSPGVQAFAANGGYFSLDGGTDDLGNFNTAHGGDRADWATGGTSNVSGGNANDAFNAFGTPGQISPVTPSDLLTLKALGFQLSPAGATEAAKALPGAAPPSTSKTNVAFNNTNDTPTTHNDIASTADTFVFQPNLGQHNNVETVTDQIQPPHSDMPPQSELLAGLSLDVHHNGQDIGVAHDASGLDQVLASHLHATQNVHLV